MWLCSTMCLTSLELMWVFRHCSANSASFKCSFHCWLRVWFTLFTHVGNPRFLGSFSVTNNPRSVWFLLDHSFFGHNMSQGGEYFRRVCLTGSIYVFLHSLLFKQSYQAIPFHRFFTLLVELAHVHYFPACGWPTQLQFFLHGFFDIHKTYKPIEYQFSTHTIPLVRLGGWLAGHNFSKWADSKTLIKWFRNMLRRGSHDDRSQILTYEYTRMSIYENFL